MLFTLRSDAYISGEFVKEKTAVKVTTGDDVRMEPKEEVAQVLFVSLIAIKKPIVWGGPIVINTKAKLQQAFSDLRQGTFLKQTNLYQSISK